MSLRRCNWRRNWDAAPRSPLLRWIPASSISPATCTRPEHERQAQKDKADSSPPYATTAAPAYRGRARDRVRNDKKQRCRSEDRRHEIGGRDESRSLHGSNKRAGTTCRAPKGNRTECDDLSERARV